MAGPARYRPPFRRWDRVAVAVTVVAFAAVSFPIFIVLLPKELTDLQLRHVHGVSTKDRLTELGRIRTAELALLGGMIAVFGACYTHRNFRLNHQGQISERFTRAIDQFGSEKTQLRLGAIYALQRIARESPVDHGPIMDILTGFLRERAARPKSRAAANGRRRLPADVQTALSVVAQRTREHPDGQALNLASVDLECACFHAASLVGADLTGANLRGADLSNVDLTDAQLVRADLVGATLRNTDLTNANLSHADLSETDLRRVVLSGPPVARVVIPETGYRPFGFSRVMLERAYQAQTARARRERLVLRGIRLVGADLSGLDLSGIDFAGADLRDARLVDAVLRDANLTGAKLAGADLTGADLTGTLLSDVDLSEVDLGAARAARKAVR